MRLLNFILRKLKIGFIVSEEELLQVLKRTRTDITLFNEYILGDPDPEPWKIILKEFFGGKCRELIMIIGRKGGKSVRAAKIALFFVYKLLSDPEYRKQFWLLPGQPIYILMVSTTQDQAENIVLDYVKSFARNSWYLKNFIVGRERGDEIKFEGNIIVRAQGSSSSAMRGYPCIVVIFDELAHFIDSTGRRGGKQVYEALKPNITLFKDEGKVIILTTPGAKTGILYELYQAWSRGELPSTMVVRKPTWELRTDLSQGFFDEERARDEETFRAEYGAEFYETIDAFLDSAKIDECIMGGQMRLGSPGPYEYIVVMDPGTKGDSYAVLLMHLEGEQPVLDYGKKFVGTKKNPVQISDVEDFVRIICRDYPVIAILIDQAQSASTVQNFKREELPIVETPFTAQYNMLIYERLKRYIHGTVKTVLPPWGDLIYELRLLTIKRRTTGFTVCAPRGYPDDAADCLANGIYYLTSREETGTIIISKK